MTNRVAIPAPRPRVDYSPDDLPGPVHSNPADAERTQRALADARFQAFTQGSAAPGTQGNGTPANKTCDFSSHHDFAACGTESIPGAVLFRQEADDVDEIDLKDVHQNHIGDCFLMAPLAALASTPEGRAQIRGMVREGKNEQGEPTYTVTLHKPESHWFGKTTFSEVTITMNASYVLGHAIPRKDGDSREVWPLVVEKAYAQLFGGYQVMHRGGSVAFAMAVLTGKDATQTKLNLFSDYPSSQIQKDFEGGKLVVLQTKTGIGGSTGPTAAARGLIGYHAYVVTGTEVVDGKACLRLHNPMNTAEPQPVPFEELHDWFSAVNVGSVR